MGSLQKMLDVYFHMRNHYNKLKNVQSRIDTNLTPRSAGRPKKPRSQSVEARSFTVRTPCDLTERPSTRRKPSVCPIDKSCRVPMSRATSHTQSLERSNAKSMQFECSTTPSSLDQHAYLQFSLRITEEIIRNDLYDNRDMLQIVQKHYDAHKDIFDKEKLLTSIVELCRELGIPWDENILNSKQPALPTKLSRTQEKWSSADTPPAPYQIKECSCTMVESIANTLPCTTTDDTAPEVLNGEIPNDKSPPDNQVDFHVLHDGTARFSFERDSDASFEATIKEERQRKPLVAAHYSTSVEPLRVETREFSIQTLDNESFCGIPQVSDASTQSIALEPQSSQRCQYCQQAADKPPQYVYVDCPVLISREPSCTVDIVPSRLNMRMPFNGFVQRSSFTIPNVGMAQSSAIDQDVAPQRAQQLIEKNLLLTDGDRYQRYKSVKDNLSAFYPTIATQVSSMELVPQRVRSTTRSDATTMFTGPHVALKQKDIDVLDKYRIEKKSSLSLAPPSSYQTGSKRHYQEEDAVDHGRLGEGEKTLKQYEDLMDRRLNKLRHGFDKRLVDDEIGRAVSTTQFPIAKQDASHREEMKVTKARGENELISETTSRRYKKTAVFKK